MKFTVRKYDLLSGNTETLYSNVDDYIYLQYVDNNYIFYALDSKTDNYRLNLSNGEKLMLIQVDGLKIVCKACIKLMTQRCIILIHISIL